MICSFVAILAWKSDDDADADNDADADADYDRKSDPYMSPSYAGDTTKWDAISNCRVTCKNKVKEKRVNFITALTFSHYHN